VEDGADETASVSVASDEVDHSTQAERTADRKQVFVFITMRQWREGA
jgi:hypothetical protein